MIPGPRNPAHAKVFGQLQVEREISWETKAVGRAHVVLENIDRGKGETGMEVKHRAGGNIPRDLDPAPHDDAVGNVAGQGGKEIGPDHRLFEGYVDGGERVQVSAGKAVNIRNVDVGIFTDFDAQRGFQFVITRRTSVAEEHEGAGGGGVKRIDDELLEGAAAEIIHSRDQVGPNFLVQLDVPGQVEGRAVEALVRGHNGPVLVLLLVKVLENNGRAGWDSLGVVVGDHARQVLGEITGQQWQAIIEEADTRSDDRLGITSRRIGQAEAWCECRMRAQRLPGIAT